MTLRLRNKTAIVTGAGSGIGRQSAIRMAEEGALVCITDIDDEGGRETLDLIGGRGFYLHHDVTQEDSWHAVIAGTLLRFGKLQILLNSAGIGVARDNIVECDEKSWDRLMAVNLHGTFMGCQQVVGHMKRVGGGSIINISSVLGLRGSADAMSYCASKGAVRLLMKSIAVHCGREGYNIRCNAICPGYIATPLGLSVRDSLGEEEFERLIDKHAVGRMGDADDVAHMVVYLASDESTFVTGTEMVVDGGYTAG